MPKSLFWSLSLLFLAGCPNPPPKPADNPSPKRQVELQLLVVDDDQLAAAVESYLATRDAHVTVKRTTSAELTAGSRPAVDLLLYPSGLLGELAERNWFLDVPADSLDSPEVGFRELARPVRHGEIKWGSTTLALPFGSPLLFVYYRTDIYESLGLQPPTTWDEYREQAERLSRREELGKFAPPADAPWYGTIEPLAPGWAGHLFLARAAAYVQAHGELSTLFRQSQLEPLLDQPPYARALTDLTAAAKFGPLDHDQLTPSAVRTRFLLGQSALAIALPTRDDAELAKAKPAADLAIGFAELPGSRDYYRFSDRRWQTRRPEEDGRVPYFPFTGRLGSVVRGSRESADAFHLLAFLTSNESQREFAPRVATLFPSRASQVTAADQWLTGLERPAARSFAAAWQSSCDRASWLLSPRLPARNEYLLALDQAVAKAVGSEPVSPTEALSEATRRWRAITTERGLESQQRAYVRSHGLEP